MIIYYSSLFFNNENINFGLFTYVDNFWGKLCLLKFESLTEKIRKALILLDFIKSTLWITLGIIWKSEVILNEKNIGVENVDNSGTWLMHATTRDSFT